MAIKNPVTPSGIDSATFRFVVQCLNHYASAYPTFTSKCVIINTSGNTLSRPYLFTTGKYKNPLQLLYTSLSLAALWSRFPAMAGAQYRIYFLSTLETLKEN
jgi:hypothetical protein